jgi:hypothetical protein
MIHVPDVRATVDWYEGIGFKVVNTYGNERDGLSFAIVSFGESQVMFSEGGQPSTQRRREVDLYVYTDNVDELYEKIQNRVDVVEKPHDTFYGMRELIIRDANRFWMTFGQPSVFSVLMNAVLEGNAGAVQKALHKKGVKPETLTAALALATGDHKNAEIERLLINAGGVQPAKVDSAVLRSYAGRYKNEQGPEINVSFKDERLFAAPGAQEPLRLYALDQTSFRPVAFDDFGTLTFLVEGDKVLGCAINHGSHQTRFTRE